MTREKAIALALSQPGFLLSNHKYKMDILFYMLLIDIARENKSKSWDMVAHIAKTQVMLCISQQNIRYSLQEVNKIKTWLKKHDASLLGLLIYRLQ